MDSLEQCFEAVLQYCKEHVVETTYMAFFRGIQAVSLKNGVARLSVSTPFQHDIISERYLDVLKDGFKSVLGFDVEVELVTAEELGFASMQEDIYSGEKAYTFDSFIEGPNNRLAYAAAQSVAMRPAQNYNPLFIYGASGLGKTHLMLAIKNSIEKRFPDYKIVYVDGEEFTNELITALKDKNTAAFHDEYRTADVLLVDDIQFIAGKLQTQEEFFHTFNAVYNAGHQIVLTSDRPPKEIQSLEDRMRSRFESGLLADISAPDFETKVAILRRKAEALQMDLPDDITNYIADHIKSNIRQLEGTVKKLQAQQMVGLKPSIGLAQNAIKDILSENQPVPVTISRIIAEVGRTFNISPEDICSKKQDAAISNARQIAIYIIREVTGLTMERIGDEFGRHYSTVVHALKKVVSQIESDHALQRTIDDIIKNCRA